MNNFKTMLEGTGPLERNAAGKFKYKVQTPLVPQSSSHGKALKSSTATSYWQCSECKSKVKQSCTSVPQCLSLLIEADREDNGVTNSGSLTSCSSQNKHEGLPVRRLCGVLQTFPNNESVYATRIRAEMCKRVYHLNLTRFWYGINRMA